MSEGTREHPAVEVWREYRARRLSEEREGELQEHLVGCHWCQELVLELARAEKEGAGEVASLETAAGWRRLRGRLVEEGVLPREKRRGLPVWVGWAAAACFAAFLVALGDDWRLRREQQQIILFEETQTGEPQDATRGPGEVIRLTRGRSAAISLAVPSELPAGDYAVEIVSPEEKSLRPPVAWRYDGAGEELTIGFRTLPQGPFIVRIVGPGDQIRAVYSVQSP